MKLSRRQWTIAGLALVILVTVGLVRFWFTDRAELARHGLPAGVVGCWALFDADGRRAEDRLYWSPSIARLDSAPNTASKHDGTGTVRVVHRLDSLRRPMGVERPGSRQELENVFSYWSVDSLDDRLRMRFSSGFSGTQFVFALPDSPSTGDTLTGRATEHWDVPPYRSGAGRAYAVRVACSP